MTLINFKETDVPCPTCNGSGKVTFQLETLAKLGVDPNVESECAQCDGTGKVTQERANHIKEELKKMCSCGNPSGNQEFHMETEKAPEHWSCIDCGKMTLKE